MKAVSETNPLVEQAATIVVNLRKRETPHHCNVIQGAYALLFWTTLNYGADKFAALCDQKEAEQ